MSESPAQEMGSGRKGSARRRGGDTPIIIAMALVTAAVGVGMFMQLALAGWLSVGAALALFLGMFSLHQLGRRSQEIASLRDELRRLENEVRRASGRAPTAPPAQQLTPPPLATSRQSRLDAVLRTPVLADANAAGPQDRASEPRGERAMPSLPPVPPAAPPTPPASGAARIAEQLARPARGPAPPSDAPATGAPASDPWGYRPADPNAPVQDRRAAIDRPAPEARATDRAAGRLPEPQPVTDTTTPRDIQPHAETPTPASKGSAVRDSDVEVIQGLIKKLADEVNANDAPQATGRDAAQARRAAATEDAIETSLEALRTTAGTMRERDEAARAARGAPIETPRHEPPAITVRQPAPPMPPPVPAPPAAVAPPPLSVGANEPPADTGEAWLESDETDAEVDPRLLAIGEAIEAGRTDIYLEPILTLVDQRPRHYEVQVRPRTVEGEAFSDDALLREMLGGSGLLPLLDRTRIARVALIARRLAERGRDSSIFSGFSGESLVDDGFLNEFANAFHERDSFASQLVLTFSLADVRAITPRERSALEDMRDLGFRFAIDHVTDLDVDFEELRAQGFQFVKLDADVFLEGLPASGGLIPASDICRHLAQLGMTLIVGGIVDEANFARIFGFGVLFGQGQLFGGPRLVKAEPAAPRRSAGAAAA